MDEPAIRIGTAVCLAAALVHLARRWRHDLPRDRFVEGRVLRVGDGVGGRVEVKAVDRDRHGRLIAEVRAGSVDVNATLVEEGHAWAYRKHIPDTRRSRYVEAQALAEQNWKGLWRPVRPTAPWKWRRGVRDSVPAALGGPVASPARSGNGAEAGALPQSER